MAVITKDTNLGELTTAHPDIATYLFEEWGLHCVNCMLNGYDTLEAGMRMHRYGEKEIAEAVAEVNRLVSNTDRMVE